MTSLPSIPIIDLPEEEISRSYGILTVSKAAQRVVLPLSKVDLHAKVADQVAEVRILQTFRNPYQEALEAIYIFPISGGSAVSNFQMKIGSRTLRGVIEERAEARRQYQQALEEGKRAGLLEQERDDVFTIQVGNLPPNEEVTVEITYSERLPFFEDGNTELRLPLVVAPRYIPGNTLDECSVGDGVEQDTDIVPDASKISPPRLCAGFDPNVGLKIEVQLLNEVSNLFCSQHATRGNETANGTFISLARIDERLNKDFVLRWKSGKEKTQTSLLLYKDEKQEIYGMLSLIPPQRETFFGVPRDVVFVLDRSGSMQGAKIASASRSCSILLSTLSPNDRFAMLAFNNHVEWFQPNGEKGDRFIAASEDGLQRGENFLRSVMSGGGTELDQAIGAAITAIGDRHRASENRIPVIVLLTDGQIGDESRVLKRIQKELGDTRVFTVGIDTAVNQGFLSRLASLGGGTATFVEPGTALEDALQAVGREIGTPLIVDLAINAVDSDIDLGSIAPMRIPDLFAGRSSTAFFRMNKSGKIRIHGKFSDGSKFEEQIRGSEIDLPAIAHLWTRTRIKDLEDRFRLEQNNQPEIKKQIIDLSIQHTLLTRFTAFVVVDESEVVNKDGSRRKIVQPVEMPALWEMENETQRTGSFASMTMAYAPQPPMAHPMKTRMQASSPKSDSGAAGIFRGIFRKHGTVKDLEDLAQVDSKKLKRALKDFIQEFRAVQSAIHSNHIPSADKLEQTRLEVMKVLSTTPVLTELAALQKLLKGAIVELIAALRTPGISVATLQSILERHKKAFDKSFHGIESPQSTPFWESTI
ncbi:VIT and VWA domain-containing protein [bacterium]|nr:VIT and VWA domain-containing protein [bacterium]